MTTENKTCDVDGCNRLVGTYYESDDHYYCHHHEYFKMKYGLNFEALKDF